MVLKNCQEGINDVKHQGGINDVKELSRRN